jgi:uncharacterized membrane protein
VISGTADAARQLLTSIAASVITVVGIVFSITIVTLTLASTQFGPRMLRNFIRDRGTQLTLGTFVATFVYCVVWTPTQVHRDNRGIVRVISDQVSYERLVQRAFEKIRQASRGMPAVMIRQLEALTTIMEQTTDPQRGQVLMNQAAMIQRANVESVPDESDRADVDRRYVALRALQERLNE